MPALLFYCIFQHMQSNGYIFQVWSLVALCLCTLPPLPGQDNPVTPAPKRGFYDPRALERWGYSAHAFDKSDSE